jgi:hypothetical protein
MFETFDQQRAAREKQEQERADRDHSWVSFKREPALTNDQLNALRDASQAVGRPLTDEERAVVISGKASEFATAK